jgi:hypothetical protein
MSEQHVEPSSNGSTQPRGRRAKNQEIATSTINGSVVTYRVTGLDEPVSVDVNKLPEHTKLEHTLAGARGSLRLSFQKLTDPKQVLEALKRRAAQMLAGEPTTRRSREPKQVDELIQALANLRHESPKQILDVWLPAYFASPKSGCNITTSGGKTRVYKKKEALAKLRLASNVAAEIERVVKQRGGKVGSEKIDLDSVVAS